MSGFAFQKLNGGATTANKQLEELKEINKDLDDVIENLEQVAEASARPDIWKLARMFHPDAVLTPVQWSWHMAGGGNYDTQGKLYYGRLQVSLTVDNFKDSARQWVDAIVWNKGNQTACFRCMHYKSSHGDYPGVNDHYIGYVDGISVWSNCDSHGRFEFQGFEVGAAGSALPPFVPPPADEGDDPAPPPAPNPPGSGGGTNPPAPGGGGSGQNYLYVKFQGVASSPISFFQIRKYASGSPAVEEFGTYSVSGSDVSVPLDIGAELMAGNSVEFYVYDSWFLGSTISYGLTYQLLDGNGSPVGGYGMGSIHPGGQNGFFIPLETRIILIS